MYHNIYLLNYSNQRENIFTIYIHIVIKYILHKMYIIVYYIIYDIIITIFSKLYKTYWIS